MTGGNKDFNFTLNVGSYAAGQHTLNLRSYDGNAYSPTISRTFRLDNTAPEISASGASSAWRNTQLTPTVTAADPVLTNQTSGLASARYALVNNNAGTTSPTSPFTSLATCQTAGQPLMTLSAPLSSLPAGSVIDLGDGHPWLWVGSTSQTGSKAGYGYIMAMYNYGDYAWGSNATADTGTIYTNLPDTIGGVDKATALASNTWQWDICSEANPTVCSNTNTYNSRLSFVSFREWQGGTGGYTTEPETNSVGNLFCFAWKNTPCLDSGYDVAFEFGYPWTRSDYSSAGAAPPRSAWYLAGYASYSLDRYTTTSEYGSLPVAWLSSSITQKCGSGTYTAPYKFDGCV
jgi:hypothetical protein